MDPSQKEVINEIIKTYKESGVIWKVTKTKHYGLSHLEKRKRRNDLPSDWTLKEYNIHIMNIMTDIYNDVHIYYLPGFTQNYFTFDNGKWIIIIEEDKIIETAMKGNPDNYFANNPGYAYLGKVKDVLK
ncbi:hypothetical protein [Lentibacillus sp.]|uniref:hypothetical protein n=1 Tax=Lentibacillus sp. TaxID=1925746 RepID=UPI002B4B2526|nr:hypothetical protein [Lentibacillus sp.]HLS07538.1 hypothetical protein [Lentibacillus sp.]